MNTNNTNRPWTETALRLRELPIPLIAARTGKGESTIRSFFRERGLGGGKRREKGVWSSVTALQDRLGYFHRTLLRIFDWAGVKAERTRKGQVWVRVKDAEAAVAAWVATETLTMAGARYGHHPEWVRLRLRAAGVSVEERGHRYSSAVIDRAVETYVDGRGGGT